MFNFDNKNASVIIIFVILALVLFFRNGFDLQSTLMYVPGLIIALTLHEYAHARKAVKLGDPTPKMQGRLNINPLSHLDPIGTICLLFAGFGWGKPVQINPTNFKNPEKDSAKVALAGPLMNILLSFVFAIIYAVVYIIAFKTDGIEIVEGTGYLEFNLTWSIILEIILYTMYLNLGLAIFNLLPFPPLDGSKIYRAILKGKAKEFIYKLENYSMIIIMILFLTHIASYIITPIMNFILNYALIPIIEAILSLAL